MRENRIVSNFFLLNLGILFISTSGVLGRTIDLPVPITIGSRALLAALVLLIYRRAQGSLQKMAPKDRPIILLAGTLLAIHWITYFYALRFSNVAIGMLSLFTFPTITALLEPLFFKTQVSKRQLGQGLLILVGIYFLIPAFDFQNRYFIAVLLGLLSALCYAVRNILMKSLISHYHESHLMVYQLIVASIGLAPFFFLLDVQKIPLYLPHLFVLAILTTAIGHTLFLYGFRNFTAFSASMVSCMQPVYGILLGIFFLNEIPRFTTLLGGGIILLTVILESYTMMKPGA